MDENFQIRTENLSENDREFEKTLRPLTFDDFKGQTKLINNLIVFVTAAKQRNEALDHVLLHGPPGLGKTTLAHIIANELNVNLRITSGPVLDKPGDLAGLLTGLEESDVLFIDEIHRLSPIVEEYLYSAMEDYQIDIMIDKKDEVILAELKKNARNSTKNIATRVKIPRVTVHDRIQKMIERGIIKSFNVTIDYKKIGFPLPIFLLFY